MAKRQKKPSIVTIEPGDMRLQTIPRIDAWFGHEFHDKVIGRGRERGVEGGLMLGCPLWGQDFVDLFLAYTLPSMLAPENLEVLRDNARIVIFAPQVETSALWETLRIVEREYGIQYQFGSLPPGVMELMKVHPHNRYPILGAVQSLLLHMAGRSGMHFHCLHPDHVYAPGYFKGMKNLSYTYDAIAQTSISASVETAGPELEQYRAWLPHRSISGANLSTLAVPDRALGDIGWRHIHPRSKLCMMNDKKFPVRLPWSHLWNWQARDKLVIHCWHVNAAFMSADLCRKVPIGLNMSTLDTQLPWMMPGTVAFPQVEDGMTFIELSACDKPAEEKPCDWETFGHRVWGMVAYKNTHMPFMRMQSELPIEPQETFLEDAEIQRQFDLIMETLIADRDRLETTDVDIQMLRRISAAKTGQDVIDLIAKAAD